MSLLAIVDTAKCVDGEQLLASGGFRWSANSWSVQGCNFRPPVNAWFASRRGLDKQIGVIVIYSLFRLTTVALKTNIIRSLLIELLQSLIHRALTQQCVCADAEKPRL